MGMIDASVRLRNSSLIVPRADGVAQGLAGLEGRRARGGGHDGFAGAGNVAPASLPGSAAEGSEANDHGGLAGAESVGDCREDGAD